MSAALLPVSWWDQEICFCERIQAAVGLMLTLLLLDTWYESD